MQNGSGSQLDTSVVLLMSYHFAFTRSEHSSQQEHLELVL